MEGPCSNALFAKLGGAAGPYLPLFYDVPLAKMPRRPSAGRAAASFLASFGALRERKGPSGALRGDTRDQTAPEGARLLCWALRPTTEIPHVAASGYYRGYRVSRGAVLGLHRQSAFKKVPLS